MELRDCILGDRFQFPPKVEMDELGAKILSELAVTSFDPINKMVDEMILKEIIQVAKDRGITDLTILNRKFILEALQEKWERMNGKEDVAPGAHGKWVKWYGDNQHHCTVCECYANAKIVALGYVEEEFLSEYCPNCGAKMDGGTTP